MRRFGNRLEFREALLEDLNTKEDRVNKVRLTGHTGIRPGGEDQAKVYVQDAEVKIAQARKLINSPEFFNSPTKEFREIMKQLDALEIVFPGVGAPGAGGESRTPTMRGDILFTEDMQDFLHEHSYYPSSSVPSSLASPAPESFWASSAPTPDEIFAAASRAWSAVNPKLNENFSNTAWKISEVPTRDGKKQWSLLFTEFASGVKPEKPHNPAIILKGMGIGGKDDGLKELVVATQKNVGCVPYILLNEENFEKMKEFSKRVERHLDEAPRPSLTVKDKIAGKSMMYDFFKALLGGEKEDLKQKEKEEKKTSKP